MLLFMRAMSTSCMYCAARPIDVESGLGHRLNRAVHRVRLANLGSSVATLRSIGIIITVIARMFAVNWPMFSETFCMLPRGRHIGVTLIAV